MAELEVLILEDDPIEQISLQARIPEGISYKLVSSSKEFKDFLRRNTATAYFIDDRVPAEAGDARVTQQFIQNCNYLLKKHPKAKVFYTGSVPLDEEIEYCRQRKIQMIPKYQITDMIKRALKK